MSRLKFEIKEFKNQVQPEYKFQAIAYEPINDGTGRSIIYDQALFKTREDASEALDDMREELAEAGQNDFYYPKSPK